MPQDAAELKPAAADRPDSMPNNCPDCAFEMPDLAGFCPGCGRSMQAAPRADGIVGIFSENVAGALAYFTFVPAIIFLLRAPYNGNRFVRFHSVQCVLFCSAIVIVGAALRLLALVLYLIPIVGYLFAALSFIVAALATCVLWVVLVVKALQGETFKLPVLGPLAESKAESGV